MAKQGLLIDEKSGKNGLCGFGYHHLLMKPEGFFGKHGELFIIYLIKVYAGEVMSCICHPLPDALVICYYPAVYKFTRMLCRVAIISDNCPIKPNKNRLSSSTNSLSPSRKQSFAKVLIAITSSFFDALMNLLN